MSAQAAAPTTTRIYRSTRDRRIGGVCGGSAESMGWDVNVVRLVAALSILLPGPQVFAYLIAWAVLPTDAQVFGWERHPSAVQPTSPTFQAPPAPVMPTPPVADDPELVDA